MNSSTKPSKKATHPRPNEREPPDKRNCQRTNPEEPSQTVPLTAGLDNALPRVNLTNPTPPHPDYLEPIYSLLSNYKELRDNLTQVRAHEESSPLLRASIDRLEGMITGLQAAINLLPTTLSHQDDPRPPLPETNTVPLQQACHNPKNRQASQQPQPTVRSQIDKIADRKITPDVSRQQIWEPENITLLKQQIHPSIFFRQLNKTLELEFNHLKAPVEAVRRLPRGGFMVQFTPEGLTAICNGLITPTPFRVELATLERWGPNMHRNALTAHPSVVLSGISQDLPESFIESELREYNHIEGINLYANFEAVRRLDRRNPITNKIEPSRSLRLFLSDKKTAEDLVAHGSVSIGGLLAIVRPYNPPQYFCFNCRTTGSHRTRDCRRPSEPNANQSNQPSPQTKTKSSTSQMKQSDPITPPPSRETDQLENALTNCDPMDVDRRVHPAT